MKKNTIYNVQHSRKGNFTLLVKDECKTWVTGIIVKGRATAIMQYNDRDQGEEITIRKSLCSFTDEISNEKSSAAGN